MITKVEIKNFESHAHTVIDLHNGFNVIHGTSNVGKSAILRAIALCAYGTWLNSEDEKKNVSSSVRHGEAFCDIRIETDDGCWVETRKGKGISEWVVFDGKEEKSYKKAKDQGPVKAREVLGFEVKEIGKLKLRLNWADQRDKHFVIDEIEGESASPSVIASIFDEVAGLIGCEEVIVSVAQDKLKYSKEIKGLDSKKKELESNIAELGDVKAEQAKLDELESLLDSIEKKQKEVETLSTLSEDLDSVLDEITANKTASEKIAEFLTNTNFVSLIDEWQDLCKKKKAIDEIVIEDITDKTNYNTILADIKTLSTKLTSLKSILSIEEQLNAVEEELAESSTVVAIPEEDIVAIEKNQLAFLRLSTIVSELSEIAFSYKKSRKRLKIAKEEEVSLEEELHSLGACPLCGNKL